MCKLANWQSCEKSIYCEKKLNCSLIMKKLTFPHSPFINPPQINHIPLKTYTKTSTFIPRSEMFVVRKISAQNAKRAK